MSRFIKLHNNLFVLGLISFILLLLFDVVFNDTEELFRGGASLVAILTNLSLSFLSGLLFYILTTYLPADEKRKRNAPNCVATTNKLTFTIRYFFLRLNGQVTTCDEQIIPPISIVSPLIKIALMKSSSAVSTTTPGVMMTNLQALEHFLVKRIIDEIAQIEILAINFEPEYLEALYALKRCHLIEDITNYPPNMWKWDSQSTLQHYESNISDLLTKAQVLVEITEKYYGKVKIPGQ